MGRRPHTALRGFVVMVLALAIGTLLNSEGLRKSAEIQPIGFGRDVALALTRPLVEVTHRLYIDRPRQELRAAIGQGNADKIDTTIALPPVVRPPLPRPTPAPRVNPGPTTTRATTTVAATTTQTTPAATTTTASTNTSTTTQKPPSPRPVFTPAHPLRVWVAGDSLAQVPGESLENAVGSGGPVDVVAVESRVATGLGRPDVYNWFERFPQAIEQLRPRVAVLSFGADDAHNYLAGAPEGVEIGPLGSPSWDAEYKRRLEGVMREFEAAHIYVVWIGLPIIRGPTQNMSFRKVDRILRDVAAEHPATCAYIDTLKMFETPKGRYTDYLREGGQLVLMRAPDGVHYEPAAGGLIAAAILKQLGQVFDLRKR
jgi:hypothetical protein